MQQRLRLMVVLILGAGSFTVAMSQTKETQKDSALVFAAPDAAEFKEIIPGVSKASVWGDGEKGAYGAFTKFKPGLDSGMHTHTHDVFIVGIQGAYVYRDEDGEKRVEAGHVLRIPAGKKHWSGGDAKEGALFYEQSTGKFDLIPAK